MMVLPGKTTPRQRVVRHVAKQVEALKAQKLGANLPADDGDDEPKLAALPGPGLVRLFSYYGV
jgi:hypothetical protein